MNAVKGVKKNWCAAWVLDMPTVASDDSIAP